ncbi:MAG: hypothetical protein KKA73_28345 [Chloroflexi bacterium]|nr:hypothetical protein [Chloroflexota bacterium]MBU1751605.1 hypothetical protein [Chloroflexota bacterium]
MNASRWIIVVLVLVVLAGCCCLLATGALGLLALRSQQAAATPEPAIIIVLGVKASDNVTPDTLDHARDVLQERLDAMGVTGATVRVDGSNLRLELAEGVDPEAVIRLATQVGAVAFWDSGDPVDIGAPTPPNAWVILTDEDVQQAAAATQDGQWHVRVVLTPAGAAKLADYTQDNVGHYLVIARDGAVISAPRVNAPIAGGEAVIAGRFTAAEAQLLAAQLNSGRLPFQLYVVEARINQ